MYNNPVMNNMAYFNGKLYVGANNMPLESFALSNGKFSQNPVSQTQNTFGNGVELYEYWCRCRHCVVHYRTGVTVPVNAVLFVSALATGVIALLKLTGFLPWGSPMFPSSKWTGRNLPSSRPAARADEPLFSRTAIVGACWSSFS